jgi:hypothetical protein
MQQSTRDWSNYTASAQIDRVFSLVDGRRICDGGDDSNGWTATVEGFTPTAPRSGSRWRRMATP